MKTTNSTKIFIVILIIALSISGWYLYNNSGARRIKHIVLISMDTTRADALRATSKDHAHYDPRKALSLALQGMEMAPESKRGAELLRALAAAYAANGNFPEAIENARLAVQSAMSHGQKQMARDIQKQMKLYRNNTPYRE